MKRRLAALGSIGALVLVAGIGGGGGGAPALASADLLNGPSQVVGVRAYLQQPMAAPAALRAQFASGRAAVLAAAAHKGDRPARGSHVFNRDSEGLPQNEESISSCPSRPNIVLGGTNDYRGLLDPAGNFTGWHFSVDGGRTVVNEGLLPEIAAPDGTLVPSGGDPVDVVTADCTLYAADISYTGDFNHAGIAVYRSTPHTLRTCTQGTGPDNLSHPDCWPTRRLVATASFADGHFLDKEWMDVGPSGSAGTVVWVAYGDLSDFNADGNEETGVIKAVRCSADLSSCTDPIALSTGQKISEYPSVTIGPDGRTYISWGQFFGGSFIGPTQRAWLAVAEPGSTTFAVHPVVTENQVVRAREKLHATNYRVGTMFKNTVAMVHGHPRVSLAWERCLTHAQDQVCEEPQIRLIQSDDLGATWGPQRVLSAGGDNIMPELDTDPVTGRTYAAWYTSRFDPVFHNRQDVELARLAPNGRVLKRIRLTKVSNETEADPVLHGTFIGDYLEIDASRGRVLVAYTANRRSVRFEHDGVPIPQQDNYLARVRE